MEQYILKLSSGTSYNLYQGTTLVADADITTLFATAGSAYFSFDFNGGTPTDTTSLSIINSESTAVITNTGLSGIAEGKNFKGTWSASATAFDSFTALTGKTLDESEVSFVMGKIKERPIVGSTLSTPSNVAYVATANIQDGAVTPAKISAATYQLDTEQVVGTWVNGKPLYRKVINFGALPNNTTKTVQIAGGSRVEVVDVHLSVHTDPDGGFATYAPVLPYYSTSNSIISANFSEYVVNVTSNGNSSSFSAYVYVYYWKKTD